MAYLTQAEFSDAVRVLAKDMGVQRLRDKLVRMNGLVSRRGVNSVEALSSQLYMLTSGLRRQVSATIAFHGIWNEALSEKLGKEREEELEELAKAVNACLDESDRVIPEKAEDIGGALAAYAQPLAAAVGKEMALLDMLLKAVPEVAERLRTSGLPEAPPAAETPGPAE